MRKIEFMPGTDLDDAVNTLLVARANGEQVYGEFNGCKLYSDTVTMDSAYIEILGCTKAEYDKSVEEWRENFEREEAERKQRKEKYRQMVNSTRIPGQDVVITMPVVIEGLKFIAENQTLSQEELLQGLLDLGCNFTFEDFNKQFSNNINLYDGMKKGAISSGASVIINMRDSEQGRSYFNEEFLNLDNESSVYHFIRVATGDQTYTKDNLDLSKASTSRSR